MTGKAWFGLVQTSTSGMNVLVNNLTNLTSDVIHCWCVIMGNNGEPGSSSLLCSGLANSCDGPVPRSTMEITESLITIMTVPVLDSSLRINFGSGWQIDPSRTNSLNDGDATAPRISCSITSEAKQPSLCAAESNLSAGLKLFLCRKLCDGINCYEHHNQNMQGLKWRSGGLRLNMH